MPDERLNKCICVILSLLNDMGGGAGNIIRAYSIKDFQRQELFEALVNHYYIEFFIIIFRGTCDYIHFNRSQLEFCDVKLFDKCHTASKW